VPDNVPPVPPAIVHPLPEARQLAPAIQWVPLGTLTVYHITEQELDQLEKGSPESTYFGFAIFLLSMGVSFLVSLLTTAITSIWLFTIFLVVTFVGILGGILLIIVWSRYQRSTIRITKVIRGRKPPEGQQGA
jgi:hypothetical protein